MTQTLKRSPMEFYEDPTVITVSVVAGVILYLYTALCFQRIAKNLRVKPSWFAWVPVLDIYLWCRICGRGALWTVLFFVPVVGLFIYVALCLKLAHACGRSRIYGLLMILPLINLFVLWMLAKGRRSLVVQRRGELQP